MLLALASVLPTSVALATELSFACARKKGLFLRSGLVGLGVRRAYRAVDRRVPWLSAVALVATLLRAGSVGPMTRAGCLALGGALALVSHLVLTRRVAPHFRSDLERLERTSASTQDLDRLRDRWEVETTTRASLVGAALVCIVASLVAG